MFASQHAFAPVTYSSQTKFLKKSPILNKGSKGGKKKCKPTVVSFDDRKMTEIIDLVLRNGSGVEKQQKKENEE